MKYTIEEQNNAIVAYMGGPNFLRIFFTKDAQEEEIALQGPEDLKFHLSWDWIMPVWKKDRKSVV